MNKDYRAMTDIELANLSKDGDADAFSEIISRHESAMRHFISPYVPIEQDAEDVCQESFKKAFLSMGTYDPSFSFNTWLFKIAKNTAIDFFRKQSNMSAVNIGESDNDFPEIPDTVSSPEDALIGTQTYDTLINAIESLPPLYREVARLRFINEYAYEEIASTLNLPLNTVRTRLRRSKEILEKKI